MTTVVLLFAHVSRPLSIKSDQTKPHSPDEADKLHLKDLMLSKKDLRFEMKCSRASGLIVSIVLLGLLLLFLAFGQSQATCFLHINGKH